MKLQIKDGKRVQVQRYFPSTATEGPGISVLRDIGANRDYSMIIYFNSWKKIVYCLQVRQRRHLQDELEQLPEPPDPGGVLISFEIMLNFAQISRFEFTD